MMISIHLGVSYKHHPKQLEVEDDKDSLDIEGDDRLHESSRHTAADQDQDIRNDQDSAGKEVGKEVTSWTWRAWVTRQKKPGR